MQEYQRQCGVCGKVWHSLVSREKEIERSTKSSSMMACGSSMQACGSCGQVGTGTNAQSQRNLEAGRTDLQRLRSCPDCGSATYNERIIDHANQLR
jgi:rubredoxin